MSTVAQMRFDLTPPKPVQREELIADLTTEERHLLLDHAEEGPFCGISLTERRQGTYGCRVRAPAVQGRVQI